MVNGALDLDGLLSISDLGNFGAGTYRLINYTGTLTNNGLLFDSVPGGFDLEVSTSTANQVNLIVSATNLRYWDGSNTSPNGIVNGGSGTWSTVVSNSNWTNSTGNANSAWTTGTAVFSGPAGGTVTVGDNEALSYTGIQFITDGYTITPGTSSTLNPTGQAPIEVPSGISATIDAVIAGGGGLAKTGDGTLTLGATNTFSGNVTVSGGTLLLSNNNALPATGILTLADGVTLGAAGAATPFIGASTVLNGNVSLTAATSFAFVNTISLGSATRTITMAGNASYQAGGPITGSGGLNLAAAPSSAPFFQMQGNSNTYTGLTTVGNGVKLLLNKGANQVAILGDLQIDAGGQVVMLDLGSSVSQISSNSSATVNGNLTIGSMTQNLSQSLAGLNGSGSVTNAGPGFRLALDIQSGNFSGVLEEGSGAGALNLVKSGSGTLTLSGSNTYTGGTVIREGRLKLLGTLGSGAVTIDGSSSKLEVLGQTIGNTITVQNGGVLTVGDGRRSGSVTGRVTLQNGELQFNREDNIKLNNNSFSGQGILTQLGSGKLTLSGRPTFTGRIKIEDGTIAGTTKSIPDLSVANHGQLLFKQKFNGEFSGKITGSGGLVKAGNGTLRLSGANTFKGNTLLRSGALEVTTGSLHSKSDVKSRGILIFNQTFDGSYNGDVAGGDLTKKGKGKVSLGGKLKIDDVSVEKGVLAIDGVLRADDIRISRGATLGGSGEIFGNVISDGTYNAGNSPGLLTINGDLTLTKRNIFDVEIASQKDFDRTRVAGTADLDGTLRVLLLNGFDPVPGDEFAILEAKRVKGRFDSAVLPASTAMDLEYLRTGVNLVVGGHTPYQTSAVTGNQFNAASALETLRTQDLNRSTDFNNNVRPVLDLLPAAELRLAFEAVMPSQAVAFSQTTFARSKSWLPQMQTRLADVRARNTPMVYATQGAADMKDVIAPDVTRWSAWVDGAGVFNQTAGFDGLRTGDASTAAGTVGADYRVSENFTTGLYAGYIGSWNDFGGSSEVNSNGTRFGIYSTYQTGGFYLNNVIGGEWNSYDWKRRIAFPGIARNASADTDGTVFETMFGGGYDWKVNNWVTMGGFSSLEYTLVSVGEFTESGAGSLNLRVQDQDADSLRTNLGVQFAGEIPINQRTLRPSLRMAWRHEYLDGNRRVNSAFAAGAGPGFNTLIPGGNRQDSLLLNGGFSMDLTDDVAGYVYYTGDLGDGSTENVHAVNAGLRWAF